MRVVTNLSFSFLAALSGLVAGCGVLFPGGGGGSPTGPTSNQTFVVHNVRVNTVGYAPGRAKVATVVLPAGMSSLADTTAEVLDDSGEVVWTCTVTGPMTDPVMNDAVYYFADFSPFDTRGRTPSRFPGWAPATRRHRRRSSLRRMPCRGR